MFDQPLLGGSYVSITLAWDRVIEFDEDANMNGQFDPGDTFQSFESPAAPTDSFNDMNLFLMPKGSTDYGDAIAISFGQDTNVEHIFAEIPTTGEYEFWVEQFSDFLGPQAYAVAWWAAAANAPITGDYNGDTVVDIEDYNSWRATFGSTSVLDADGNGNNVIDAADYAVWRDNLGAGSGSVAAANVPEPSGVALLVVAVFVLLTRPQFGRD